ncbi:DUF4232 domain-containing protein [Actinacidiphila acidipaludis]|uniref:DUF4232 domain-containing protein n=1 Tax=Actinacidiphila acidipaludis TaxID=2873382 RepID=A0ABS7Q5E5_9ACTN|nr:DUF4232 domain-containing protein [Streptomyces acidipaludis]MBY8878375.1 DUF4232 domain-containing protein [Streptomyces acidipaludis]
MTVFPDDHRDGDLNGPEGGGTPDPLERLLRPPAEFLAVPPGAFEQIRRRATRRRLLRAAAGGSAAVAVVAGALYFAGSPASGGADERVGPPASQTRATSPRPATSGPATHSPTARPTDGSHTSRPPAGGPGTVTSPAGTGTATPSPSDTGGTATPMCTADQLTPSLGGGDAGAGNLYRYLVVTNHSATACHLAGYPGVSLLDDAGRQIGRPADRDPRSYQPVVLQPGASASDTIHTANQMGTCQPASSKLRIYPPGSRASLVFAGQVTICDDQFTITPFTAGTTGNPPS